MKRKWFLRTISVLIILLLSVIGTFAASDIAVNAETKDALPGAVVSVPVNMTANPGFVSLSIDIIYDTDVLTLIGVNDNDVIPGPMHSEEYTSPYRLYWENDVLEEDFTGKGAIVELMFRVSTAAEEGWYEVALREVADGAIDANGEVVPLTLTDGAVVIEPEHTHVFSEWKRDSKHRHIRTCECGEAEYGRHEWNEGEVTIEPTEEEEGEVTYTCEVCQAEKYETLDRLPPAAFASIVSVDRDRAQIDLSNDQAGLCIVAVYNDEGKVVTFGMKQVDAFEGNIRILYPSFDQSGDYTVRVFLVDDDFVPLYPYVEEFF